MRLWSVHPRYLDRAGLTACWREALLAQKVLAGSTVGYRRHTQLERFLPGSALAGASAGGPGDRVVAYLHALAEDADARGYRFDRSRIAGWATGGVAARGVVPATGVGLLPEVEPVDVADGQVAYEWALLRAKLAARSPDVLDQWRDVVVPEVHPLFRVVPGPVATWEVVHG